MTLWVALNDEFSGRDDVARALTPVRFSRYGCVWRLFLCRCNALRRLTTLEIACFYPSNLVLQPIS